MGKIENKNLCKSVMKIQKILEDNNLELVVWPNVHGQHCIFAILKGKEPWTGVRVATITQKVSFLKSEPK